MYLDKNRRITIPKTLLDLCSLDKSKTIGLYLLPNSVYLCNIDNSPPDSNLLDIVTFDNKNRITISSRIVKSLTYLKENLIVYLNNGFVHIRPSDLGI